MSDWYRDTPEARRMLERERAKVAKDEARYQCQRCGKALEPDCGLSDLANRLRAWMWRQAHRLNCRGRGEEPTMSPDELQGRVDAVIAVAVDDEAAHYMEDRLHRDVIEAFCPEWVWAEVKRLSAADFCRWYA